MIGLTLFITNLIDVFVFIMYHNYDANFTDVFYIYQKFKKLNQVNVGRHDKGKGGEHLIERRMRSDIVMCK